MEKAIRIILKDIGETLSRLRAGLFIAAIGAVVAVVNWDSLIKATSLGEYVGLVFFWLFVLIVISVIGELGCKYIGYGFVWLSEWYPVWFYFPKLDLDCHITLNKEIEMRVTNLKFWQKITLRDAYHSVYEAKSRPSIRGVASPDVKELLPLDTMTGRDARIRIIGRLVEGGMLLSTGNKSEEVKIRQPGFYYYEVSCNGEFRGRKYSGGGKIPIKITENHEVKCG